MWLRSWLRCGGRLFSLHLGHQGKGRQARSGPSYRGGNDAPAHRLSDGALRLGGRGLLGVETLRVTAWGGDLEVGVM